LRFRAASLPYFAWFRDKEGYDTAQKQAIGLLQWMDNSGAKEKIGRRDRRAIPPFQLRCGF
jgi:hypothetical protein